jgi:hypothetical protein
MPKTRINILGGQPLLDIGSYARRGPQRRTTFSRGELQQISRTVGRAPEVVVKVLSSKGSYSPAAVGKHLAYIGRYGKLDLETDEGERISGRKAGRRLIDDWNLDLIEHRRTRAIDAVEHRSKLVHKLVFSMPAGTSPDGLLAATRNFLREEFGGQHRYAFVLHTDRPQPHVHVVLKAVSQKRERLHITKNTLRSWRQEFARHLREQGIAANATDRAVRGQTHGWKRDGIFRAMQRGDSTWMRDRVETVARDLARGEKRAEPGKADLLRTRGLVDSGWRVLANQLRHHKHDDLAMRVERFASEMPPPLTEREWIARELLSRVRESRSSTPPPRTR